MEDFSEPLCVDFSFDIEILVQNVLRNTISTAIEGQMEKMPQKHQTLIPKDIMLENILAYNMDILEDQCYITTGANGKLFLCGNWLLRPVLYDGKSVSMMEYLKFNLTFDDVEFLPYRDAIEFRKKNWLPHSKTNSSYDVPRQAKIDMFRENEQMEKMRTPMQEEMMRKNAEQTVNTKKRLEDLVQEISEDDFDSALEPLETVPEEEPKVTEKQKKMLDQLVDSVLEK